MFRAGSGLIRTNKINKHGSSSFYLSEYNNTTDRTTLFWHESTQPSLIWFQLMLEAQNRRIDDLIEEIRQQQERLEKQNVRIKNLQSQVILTARVFYYFSSLMQAV